MFVPRSLRVKEINLTHQSKKAKLFQRRVDVKNLNVIDERVSELGNSSLEKQVLSYSMLTTTPHVSIQTSIHSNSNDDKDIDTEEEIVSYSKNQRWPVAGEPVCVVCGRYGAYIVDQTDNDVCSFQCKAKHLKRIQREEEAKDMLDNNTTLCYESSNDDFIGSYMKDKEEFHYKEHPFVSGLSMHQVEDIRVNLNIKVKGENVSKPVLEFRHCQLDEMLSSNLFKFGYATPTPIQMQVIPVALSFRDVLACAQTGSGKTAAFLVPMIQRVYSLVGK